MLYTILFTGHMIDKKGRENTRFAAAKENEVRHEIEKQILKEKEFATHYVKGIASAACGGDIIFHELCVALEIPSNIYLALQEEDFKRASVSFAGKNWEERFDELVKRIPVNIVEEEENTKENIWEQTNLWMLEKALENGGENMSLIALWDGEKGDGAGGTEHMIKIAKASGARINIIDIKKI